MGAGVGLSHSVYFKHHYDTSLSSSGRAWYQAVVVPTLPGTFADRTSPAASSGGKHCSQSDNGRSAAAITSAVVIPSTRAPSTRRGQDYQPHSAPHPYSNYSNS